MSESKDNDQKMTVEENQKAEQENQAKQAVDFESKKWDKIMEDDEKEEKMEKEEQEGASSRDQVVAKIFNIEQFRQVCWECNELIK